MMARVERPDRLPVGDPELVACGRASTGFGAHDASVAGMPDRDVHRDELLTASRKRALLDPHPERFESPLRVAHEREQLLDRRQAGVERDDLRSREATADG